VEQRGQSSKAKCFIVLLTAVFCGIFSAPRLTMAATCRSCDHEKKSKAASHSDCHGMGSEGDSDSTKASTIPASKSQPQSPKPAKCSFSCSLACSACLKIKPVSSQVEKYQVVSVAEVFSLSSMQAFRSPFVPFEPPRVA
jgi:hypothetical protein